MNTKELYEKALFLGFKATRMYKDNVILTWCEIRKGNEETTVEMFQSAKQAHDYAKRLQYKAYTLAWYAAEVIDEHLQTNYPAGPCETRQEAYKKLISTL